MKVFPNWIFLLIAGFCVFIGGVLYAIQSPLRNARKIVVGDSLLRVQQLLGEPTEVYQSTAALRASGLKPMSYAFRNIWSNRRKLSIEELPGIDRRADWHPFGGTAGHLVFYDENGVAAVYWGGT